MKKTLLLLFVAGLLQSAYSQIYMGKQTTLHFLSKSELEDIEATNKLAQAAMNAATGKVQVKVQIKAFKFKSSFMEEHFNENYMESEKYPFSSFDGKINEPLDLSQEGEQKVTCTGKLTIHGVTNDVTLPCLVKVKGGQVTVTSEFKVKLVDYKIKVPSLYVKNIAEEITVDLTTVMEPVKK
jgi:polyisoprenoid-binding protein YceI